MKFGNKAVADYAETTATETVSPPWYLYAYLAWIAWEESPDV